MHEPQRSGASPPRRSRLRRRLGFVLCAALVLWLAGQGLGWFGSDADSFAVPQGEPEAALPAVRGLGAARVVVPEAAAAAAVPMAPSRTGDQGGREGAEQLPAPGVAPAASPAGEAAPVQGGSPAPPAPAAAATAADAAEGLDDAVATGASLVRFLVAERRHARGEAALAALTEVANATPSGRATVAILAAELDALAKALVDELAAALTAGQVLLAADLWSRLRGVGDRPPAEVAQRLAAQGLELLLRPLPSAAVGSVGDEPVPLPRQRRVRVAGLGLARLLRWEARQASVDAGNGTFPVVPHHDLEPIDATADEAVEMGWAAGCGGAWAMARLWLLCAERRAGPGGLGARAVSLRAVCGG